LIASRRTSVRAAAAQNQSGPSLAADVGAVLASCDAVAGKARGALRVEMFSACSSSLLK
jgi:hypothetical protein